MDRPAEAAASPLLADKHYDAPSVFQPEALLREARRQKRLPAEPVPPVCLLDPDGDLVAHLTEAGRARPHRGWACYHTELVSFELPGVRDPIGAIGRAVGASFAVLLAEQLFASGCRLLLSVSVGGTVWHDLDADGTRDAGEPAIVSQEVFLDQNRNRVRDVGEQATLTDALGRYAFAGLPAGRWFVSASVPVGSEPNSTASMIWMPLYS